MIGTNAIVYLIIGIIAMIFVYINFIGPKH